MDHNIRFSQKEDGECLLRWMSEPSTLEWFPMSLGEEIVSSVSNWSNFFKYKSSLTSEVNGRPIAIGTIFLMPYKKVSHQGSFYIVVDGEYRRKGVGSSMVKNLLNLGQNYFRLESLYGEVFEGCPIIPILKNFGFEQFDYQPYFVKENGNYKTRILMERYL